MSPQDHNRTLGIIFSFLGGLLLAAAVLELVRVVIIEKELARIESDSNFQMLIIIGMLFMVIFLSTAYGLFKRRRWARILSLVLTGIFVLLFPLGTALAVYTWWFMHSDGAKGIYKASHS